MSSREPRITKEQQQGGQQRQKDKNEDEDDQETYRTPIKLVEDIDAAGQDEGIDLEEREVDRMEVDEFTSEALIVARAPSRY